MKSFLFPRQAQDPFCKLYIWNFILQAVLDLRTGYVLEIRLRVCWFVSWNLIFIYPFGQSHVSKTSVGRSNNEVIIRNKVVHTEEITVQYCKYL